MSIIREERIGGQRLILGDCLDVMPLLGRFDAVVTDPPYGIGFPYASYDDTRESLRRLVDGMFSCREQFGRMVILCGPTQIHEYPPCEWVGAVTWNTTGSFGKFGFSQWTPVLLYGEDIPGFGSVNGVTKTDTYQINGGGSVGFQRDKTQKLHTCPKPINIMVQMVQRYSEADATILDPFLGSGTTLVACQKLGRAGTGIEIDPDYFDIACKRVDEATRQPDMFVTPTQAPATQEVLL